MNIPIEEYERLICKDVNNTQIQSYIKSNKDISKILEQPKIIEYSCIRNRLELLEENICDKLIHINRSDHCFDLQIEIIANNKYLENNDYIKSFTLNNHSEPLFVEEFDSRGFLLTELPNGKWSYMKKFYTGLENPIPCMLLPFTCFTFKVEYNKECPYIINLYRDGYMLNDEDHNTLMSRSINNTIFCKSSNNIKNVKTPMVSHCDFKKQEENNKFLVKYDDVEFELPCNFDIHQLTFAIHNTKKRTKDYDCRIKDITISAYINYGSGYTLSKCDKFTVSGTSCKLGDIYFINFKGHFNGTPLSFGDTRFFNNVEKIHVTVTFHDMYINADKILPKEEVVMTVDYVNVYACSAGLMSKVEPSIEQVKPKSKLLTDLISTRKEEENKNNTTQ